MKYEKVLMVDFVEILNGYAFNSKQFSDSSQSGYPVARIRDVVRGFSETFYSGEYDEKYIINNGDYLIGMDGEFNIAQWRGGKALLNQRVCKINSVKHEKIDKRFLYYFLIRKLSEIEDKTPFVTVKHLSARQINNIEIPLPPLDEQKRIASILDQAECLRSKREEALSRLDDLMKSIFLDMFGDPEKNEIEWTVETIGDICNVKGGKRLPKGHNYSEIKTPYRYIRVADINNGQINPEWLNYLKPETHEQIKRYKVHTGDVIISIAGTVGVTVPVGSSLDSINLTENAAKLVPKKDGLYTPNFLSFMFQTNYVKQQIEALTGQVTIKKLALFRIKKIKVVLPPLELQMKFDQVVKEIDIEKELMKTQSKYLDNLFYSLQQAAFSGIL